MSAKPKIVVAGGGFAGLEAAYLLRMRIHDEADIFLVSATDRFLFKPNTIYIPFGADPETFYVPLGEALSKKHIAFFQNEIKGVDPDNKHVSLDDGSNLPYDFLVLATGASMRPSEIPGLGEHAATIWTPDEMLELRKKLERLKDNVRKGESQSVLFLVPPNNKCSGPLYEMVFMLETWLRREELREKVDVTYSTFEKGYIQAFGPRLHEVVSGEFAERGIDGHLESIVTEVAENEVRYESGQSLPYDVLIAFPPYISAMTYDTLPHDDRGFLETTLETRQVVGHPDIYAPGDGGDFPVKQAFLAFLQADAVANHIASRIRSSSFKAPFDPVSMCVMEMFDKATFAQVPLKLTGNPEKPVEVRPGADDDYKVGVSPMWRLGKKLLGVYLPMRFRAGEPFHAGTAWQLMDVGLKGMSGVLAD